MSGYDFYFWWRDSANQQYYNHQFDRELAPFRNKIIWKYSAQRLVWKLITFCVRLHKTSSGLKIAGIIWRIAPICLKNPSYSSCSLSLTLKTRQLVVQHFLGRFRGVTEKPSSLHGFSPIHPTGLSCFPSWTKTLVLGWLSYMTRWILLWH